ncbi:UDP-N-acetylmuramate--L-alanine ligase [Oceanispirochaeta sp.]|uniref:UDP-N-acetylmuramate--L-alanine ligase n=1 Tax=Oceanispirochaeta sp. TaxID=2035350 RepID=UPI002638C3BA|nr:UDP-N-acetylmuramate--L-alanine ligase [Oceanispirochaeta sp.]MDA3956918.1 UDP-N-acetylmuramate--L-alanine ligase [Oceanispirochaeta sp.]
MIEQSFSLRSGQNVYMVGIKGTGMAALAEIFQSRGLRVSGSDVEEEFYTDKVLQDCGIPFFKGFSPDNIPGNLDFAVRSAAYGTDHPEVALLEERNIPLLLYPEALGLLSREHSAAAVAGVHGKTTTTALCGTLVQSLGLAGTVLVGSAVPAFGNRSTLVQGNDFFLAETCEYRRHFMYFSPDRMILTSVEADHLDYFKDEADVENAFCEFIATLPEGGSLIYCHDDPGAFRTALRMAALRPDIRMIPYGFQLSGEGKITKLKPDTSGENQFTIEGIEALFRLRIPGDHVIQDAAAALLLVLDQYRSQGGGSEKTPPFLKALEEGIYHFTGSRRRSEIVGEARGILIMDDYGHHPSAVRKTLEGIRDFYPGRRIVVDFMSHTYSRTAALLDDFASSFGAADEVILHKIYASAREHFNGRISGRDLFNKTCEQHKQVLYFEEPAEALPYLNESLKEGDLFVTMGAGDNWQLGRSVYARLKETPS